jgi:hypothetical protein
MVGALFSWTVQCDTLPRTTVLPVGRLGMRHSCSSIYMTGFLGPLLLFLSVQWYAAQYTNLL